MRVVGVDPSLTATGVATLDFGPVLGSGESPRTLWRAVTVRTDPTGPSVEARYARLDHIVTAVRAQFVRGSLVVLEAPAFSRQAGSRHERSGLWWLLASAAVGSGCRLVEVSPTARARYATGKGKAEKRVVVDEVNRRYGLTLTDHNQADAVALAALGMRLAGLPIETTEEVWMPQVAATVLGEL